MHHPTHPWGRRLLTVIGASALLLASAPAGQAAAATHLPATTPSAKAAATKKKKATKKKATVKIVKSRTKKAVWDAVREGDLTAFPKYKTMGVGIWMTGLRWRNVASKARPANPKDPNDPAYTWPTVLDFAVREAAKQGIKVFVRVNTSPEWASGEKDPTFIPDDPQDYADFMYAASKRYPGVAYWDVWEETTRAGSFKPLVAETRGQPLNAAQAAAPKAYALMLDKAYASLKAADAKDVVVGGNSFVSGDISPKNFIRNLRLPNGKPPRMDMYAHNPFSGRAPALSKPPLPSGFADFSDLDTLNTWITQNLKRSKTTKKVPKIFVTEFTFPTDQANFLFNFYVSRKTQADWLRRALKETRKTPYIATLAWQWLRDMEPNAQRNEVHWGLLDYKGNPKPAYDVFVKG